MIYFIESAGMVKIGHSENPRRRLEQLAIGCPFECSLLGVMDGGMEYEGELHSKFSRDRIKGEWFQFTDAIRLFIEQNARPFEGPGGYTRRSDSRFGMSDEELAAKLGVSRSMVTKIKLRKATASLPVAVAIHRITGASYDSLVAEVAQ